MREKVTLRLARGSQSAKDKPLLGTATDKNLTHIHQNNCVCLLVCKHSKTLINFI